MKEKNPYENGVDIPDFVESKDSNIDKSLFKIDDEEAQEEYDEEEYEDEEEGGSRKLSARGIMIIGVIGIVLCLVLAGFGVFFGISQKNKYKALEAEYNAVNEKLTAANNQITELQNEITVLKTQQANNSSSASSSADGGTAYKTNYAINVRNSAGGTAFATWSDIPSDLQNKMTYNSEKGSVVINDGVDFTVYELKEIDSNTWGKVVADKDVWVCLVFEGENFASAK